MFDPFRQQAVRFVIPSENHKPPKKTGTDDDVSNSSHQENAFRKCCKNRTHDCGD